MAEIGGAYRVWIGLKGTASCHPFGRLHAHRLRRLQLNGEDRVFARQYVLSPNGSRQLIVEAFGFDNPASQVDCVGWIRATKLR